MGKEFVNKNFKELRRKHGSTQQEFADLLKIKRASVGAYEEGRAKPNLEVLQQLSDIFDITLDALITKDISKMSETDIEMNGRFDSTGKKLRVLSITVDQEEKENIQLVPVKASAGYLSGYADPEYIKDLPRFNLPMLPIGTYRAFEIKGDSMLPLQPGSIVIGEYVENWEDLKDGHTYVILSQEDGVVYKRVFNSTSEKNIITCQSDNPSYAPFEIHAKDILEIWKAKLFISKAEPYADTTVSQNDMMQMLHQLQQQVMDLKKEN